jgi:isopentenyl-diphosphate delta-isomerase
MNEEYVVLVDENDKEIGTMEKLQAHVEGKLHRAVSVILFNSQKQMLLQKRADGKYHSAGLWSNACCSHPRPGENSLDAAKRRLYEELGIRCELQKMFEFSYNLKLDKNLYEHEFDHVYAGISNDIPLPDPSEVSDWKYTDVARVRKEIEENPSRFTEWFILIMDRLK